MARDSGDNRRMRFGEALVADDDLLAGATRAAREAVTAAVGDGARPTLARVFVCGDDPDEVAGCGRRASELTESGCRRRMQRRRGDRRWSRHRGNCLGQCLDGGVARSSVRTFHLDVLRGSDSLAVLGMPEPRPEDVVAVLLADPYTFPADGFVEQANDQLPGLPLRRRTRPRRMVAWAPPDCSGRPVQQSRSRRRRASTCRRRIRAQGRGQHDRQPRHPPDRASHDGHRR